MLVSGLSYTTWNLTYVNYAILYDNSTSASIWKVTQSSTVGFFQSSARVKSKHAPVLLRRAGHNPPTIILVGGLCVWAAWPSPQDVCLFIDEFVLKTPKTPQTPQGSEQEFIETNSRFHCVVLLRPCPTNPKIVILIHLEPCLVYLPRPYSTTPSTYETN